MKKGVEGSSNNCFSWSTLILWGFKNMRGFEEARDRREKRRSRLFIIIN